MMWSDEAKELARQCRADGLSASNTAVVLNMRIDRLTGILLTKNAVIGCWSRMGLSKTTAGDVAAMMANRAERLARRAEQRANHDGAMIATPLEAAFVPPQQYRRQLHDLNNATCRWPYGDPGTPDFFFCGADGANIESNCPYCPHHMRVAYARR